MYGSSICIVIVIVLVIVIIYDINLIINLKLKCNFVVKVIVIVVMQCGYSCNWIRSLNSIVFDFIIESYSSDCNWNYLIFVIF